MSQSLKSQVGIITGGGRGIGKAFALRFAEEGAKLLIPDINLGNAERVAKEIREKGGEAVKNGGLLQGRDVFNVTSNRKT